MQLVLDILVWLLLGLGSFFSITAGMGVVRFPDFYSRLHPAGKNDTLGVLLFCSGMLIECMKYEYGYLVAGRLVLMVLFMMMASPIACHAITQAAWLDGLKPWRNGEPRR